MDFILVQTIVQSYDFLLSHKHTWQTKHANKVSSILPLSKVSVHNYKIKRES